MLKLLVAVDGSIYSRSVCDHTAWLASRTDAHVTLLHVIGRRIGPRPESNLSGNIGLGARTALLEELAELDGQHARLAQKRGRAVLEDAEALLREAGVTHIDSKLRNDRIVAAVEELHEGMDLIVVGKRGEGADFAKMHLGANVERIVRASTCPVMVASRAFKPVKRMMIAFDGGKSSMKAVNYIARSGDYKDTECLLLWVGKDNPGNRRQLEGAARVLREAGQEVTESLEDGDPETVIKEVVKEREIDVLLMGAYGHSRIRQFIIGSTTSEMIRDCLVPVVLFR